MNLPQNQQVFNPISATATAVCESEYINGNGHNDCAAPRRQANKPEDEAYLCEIDDLMAAAAVPRLDMVDAALVAQFAIPLTDLEGQARQAGLEALRALITHCPASERALLPVKLNKLFPRQNELLHFLASCSQPPELTRFLPLSLTQLLEQPAKQWHIEQVFGPGDIGMIFGPPGSGKTFVIISLIISGCLGQQFAERFQAVRLLNIAYCAGEGLSGLGARFDAAAKHYGVKEQSNLTLFNVVPQLFNDSSPDSITRFIKEWQARQITGEAQALDLLVIDTLHSATIGADENSAQDMGKVLGLAKQATRELGCAVLLVHHSNKAGTGERGSSAMRGAMDFMIEVKPQAGKYVMSCEKLKDAPAWQPQTFDLVALADSARVRWDVSGEADGDGRKSDTGKVILRVLDNADECKVTIKQISEACSRTPQAINRVVTRLHKDKLVEQSQNERSDKCFAITEKGRDALRNSKTI